MAYNVSDFKSIEIITPPGSNFYGARAINGAVILTFKDGDEIVTDRPLLGGIVERIKGFSPLREFYSPKYTSENINSEAPDYRNTLYWNPKVTVVNGEHELFFFTSDNLSRYKIFIEGITESGKICLGTGEFEVNNFRESSVDLMSSSLPAPSSLLKDTFNSLNSNIQVNLTKVYSTTKKKVEQMSPYSTSQYLQRNTLTKNHVSGTVQNRNFDPVEFATLYNISKETSCITNINGEFNLEATIGDSIRIQHLNYHTIEYIIQKPNSNYLLGKKDFLIDEVIVSPQFAFDLFSKSCENTYNSFKSENISRALCRFERKNGSNVSQIIYLDLDIIQKKQKNFKRGERIIPYKIQERIEKNPNVSDSTLELTLKMFYPLIHQIYWVDLPQHFSYYKKEDPIFIKLLLKSKLTYHYPCNMEVIIQKSDTTLKSFAIVKKDIVAKQERRIVDDINRHTFIKDTLEVDKTYHIIEYSYSDGFGYLSKYVQGVVFADPNDPQSRIEITQQLKTYNNGKIQLNKRPKQRRIFDNSFDPLLVKNRYEEIFWKTEIDWNKSP
ncbi:MAG: hypothetical protein HQ522_23790 [Bacteroidetes bacterium]|nr:hypothetical protein [Bacteroidota bacterium]